MAVRCYAASMARRKYPPVPSHRIRELRLAAGLTQPAIAAALDVDVASVSRWESRGGVPDHQKLALAKFYGVSVPWLMGWENDEKKT